MSNIFSRFPICLPLVYQDRIKQFCSTAGNTTTRDFVPFNRQVDFLFFCLCFGFKRGISQSNVKFETYEAISADILDENRVNFMQLIAISCENDINILIDEKRMFDICVSIVNSSIPIVLDILSDIEGKPLLNVCDAIEDLIGS